MSQYAAEGGGGLWLKAPPSNNAYPTSSTPPALGNPPSGLPVSQPQPPIPGQPHQWPPGIRLPTTPSAYPGAYQRGPSFMDQPGAPGQPSGTIPSPRGSGIVSPTPRYPNPTPGFAAQPPSSKLELELLRQQQQPNPGFWSPQPRPASATFTSPPQRGPTPGIGFHSPPLSSAGPQLGASLPPKFLAKQSPSVTPASAGLHPNHQQSQLSASLAGANGHANGGLLSIQTSASAPSVTSADIKLEPGAAENPSSNENNGISPTSTTTAVQEPPTSSSDDQPKDSRAADKEILATNGGEGEVSTSRISPSAVADNSSTSAATDTPTSLAASDPDEKNEEKEGSPAKEPSHSQEATNPAQVLTQTNASAQSHDLASNVPIQESASASTSKTSNPQESQNAQGSDLAPTSALVMDVDPPVEPITPVTTPAAPDSATPTSQESAQALLSLAQGPVNHGAPAGNVTTAGVSAVAAAQNLQNKIAMEALRRVGGFLQQQQTLPPSFQSPQPQATITRPPGLGPAPPSTASPLSANFPSAFGRPLGLGNFGGSGTGNAQGQTRAAYSCPICGFECNSKFHFNSHMNTHTDHQCTMCDYTARTEGRLKRHMEGHSEEDRIRAGVNAQGERLSEAERVVQANRATSNGSQRTPDTPATSSGDASNQSGGPEPSPLERLQMQLEDTAPTSITQTIAATQEATPTPRRSGGSSSKPKALKCKQCDHVSRSKEESWRHNRQHIKPDKLLTCPQCEFVTEYKHHLEYHLRNHFGSKPFKCSKCHYECVNKSMLNSHMKSHSSFYQFRCSDCTYATKYCHSLKLHLRKYNHRPATVVAADGTVLDPAQNLDLYGTRARQRNSSRQRESSSPSFGSPNSSNHGDAQVRPSATYSRPPR